MISAWTSPDSATKKASTSRNVNSSVAYTKDMLKKNNKKRYKHLLFFEKKILNISRQEHTSTPSAPFAFF